MSETTETKPGAGANEAPKRAVLQQVHGGGDIYVNNPYREVSLPPVALFAAIIAAQAEFGAVAKDTKNEFFKSKYADLAAVKESAQPVLTKHGLGVVQEPGFKVIGDKVYDTLATTVIHESGQSRTSTMVLKPVKADPQAQGSAITYAKRYAFMAILGLVADDDDDGNAASGNTRSKPAAKPAAAKKPTPAEAIANVKKAVLSAGATSEEAVAYYAAENDGAEFKSSTNLVALRKMFDHYTAVAAAKSELGATEV